MAISYRVERINPDNPLYRIHQLDDLGQARVVHRSAIPDVKDIQVTAENRVNAPDKSERTQEIVCTHWWKNI